MKISLLLATLGRSFELERFMTSLDNQTYRNFELIVIDQNTDARLDPILRKYRGRFSFVHVRSDKPGLSRSRNEGMKHLSQDTDLLAFPDDDCWYPRKLLAQVTGFLSSRTEIGGLSGICTTTRGTSRGRWATTSQLISKYRIFGRCISFTMFLRKSLVDKIGPFDENLGLGPEVRWPGAEDFDYLLRAASADQSSRVLYSPQFRVFHDDLPSTFDEKRRARRYGDARGFGHFLRKHQYPAPFLYYYSSRYLADAAFCWLVGNKAKASYRWTAFLGTRRGFFDDSKLAGSYNQIQIHTD
jgi:glycosyltransferase involved in cell wall biosynthesis